MKWYSWLILTSLNLLIFIQTAIQLSVSALQPYMTYVYPQLDAFGAVAPSLLFLITFLPLGLLTSPLNRIVPFILTLTVTSALTLVGSILRYFLVDGYGYFITGTLLVAIAQPFIFNNQSLIAQRLVSEKYQGTVNGFMSMVGGVAGALGWLVIPFLIQDSHDATTYLPKMELFCIVLEVISSVLLIVTYVALFLDASDGNTVVEDTFFQYIKKRKIRYHRISEHEDHDQLEKQQLRKNMVGFSLGDENDIPKRVTTRLKWFGGTQGSLDGISNLLNNTLQLAMMNSTLNYTNSDIFWAGFIFYVPVAPFPFLIGLLVDKLKRWGDFSFGLIFLNALITFGLVYTPNVNKVLFFVFVCLYSLSSGTIVTACLAFVNVLLDKLNDPAGGELSVADGNSDTINSIIDWVGAIVSFVLLFVSAFVDMNVLNILLVIISTISSIVGMILLARIPRWRSI